MTAIVARATVPVSTDFDAVNAAVWRHCRYALGCFPYLPVHLYGWTADRIVHDRSDSVAGPFTVLVNPEPATATSPARISVWAVDGDRRLTDPLWITPPADLRALTMPVLGRQIVAAINATAVQATEGLASTRVTQLLGEHPTTSPERQAA